MVVTPAYTLEASRGSGSEAYCLLVSVWFGDIHSIADFSEGWNYESRVSIFYREQHLLIFKAHNFPTQDDARAYYASFYLNVSREIARSRLSAFVSPIQEIDRTNNQNAIANGLAAQERKLWVKRDPEIDGIVGIGTYIIPEHERILFFPSLTAKFCRLVSESDIASLFCVGNSRVGLLVSDKLSLALEIAAEANTQKSRRLEFLGFVNALEVLIEDKELTPCQADLMRCWKSALDAALSSATDAQQIEELTESGRQMDIRSISNGLRRLASVDALDFPHDRYGLDFRKPDKELRLEISEMYSVRSQLLHSGRVEDTKKGTGAVRLQRAAQIARYFFYCVVMNRLHTTTDPTTTDTQLHTTTDTYGRLRQPQTAHSLDAAFPRSDAVFGSDNPLLGTQARLLSALWVEAVLFGRLLR